MKTTDTLLLVAAGGVAAVAAWQLYKARSGSSIGFATSPGDAERLAGVQHLYAANQGQQAATDAAIAANWQALTNSVFQSQPDFWV